MKRAFMEDMEERVRENGGRRARLRREGERRAEKRKKREKRREKRELEVRRERESGRRGGGGFQAEKGVLVRRQGSNGVYLLCVNRVRGYLLQLPKSSKPPKTSLTPSEASQISRLLYFSGADSALR